MKKSERRKFVRELLSYLNWMKSRENAERMEDKGMMKSGIAHDALMMTFDFAEKEGISLIQLLDWLVVGVGMQRTGQVREDFMKVWKTIEPLMEKDFKRRKGVSV
jgi:hypothetical protein